MMCNACESLTLHQIQSLKLTGDWNKFACVCHMDGPCMGVWACKRVVHVSSMSIVALRLACSVRTT
jgi:hypothetical protein